MLTSMPKSNTQGLKSVTFLLDESYIKRLDKKAKAQGVSRSLLMRNYLMIGMQTAEASEELQKDPNYKVMEAKFMQDPAAVRHALAALQANPEFHQIAIDLSTKVEP